MPTYTGTVPTPTDASILLRAAAAGALPVFRRRLTSSERLSIKAGDVFVWEEGVGMQRWTDGRRWGPSRVQGGFLWYREVEEGRGRSRSSLDEPASSSSVTAAPRPTNTAPALTKQTYSLPPPQTPPSPSAPPPPPRLHLVCYSLPTPDPNLPTPTTDPALAAYRNAPNDSRPFTPCVLETRRASAEADKPREEEGWTSSSAAPPLHRKRPGSPVFAYSAPPSGPPSESAVTGASKRLRLASPPSGASSARFSPPPTPPISSTRSDFPEIHSAPAMGGQSSHSPFTPRASLSLDESWQSHPSSRPYEFITPPVSGARADFFPMLQAPLGHHPRRSSISFSGSGGAAQPSYRSPPLARRSPSLRSTLACAEQLQRLSGSTMHSLPSLAVSYGDHPPPPPLPLPRPPPSLYTTHAYPPTSPTFPLPSPQQACVPAAADAFMDFSPQGFHFRRTLCDEDRRQLDSFRLTL